MQSFSKWTVSVASTCLFFASFALLPNTASAAPTAHQARKADDVVESLGAVAHLSWTGTVYDTRFADIKAAFEELGLRYYRADAGSFAAISSKISQLTAIGMKGVFIVSKYVGAYHTQLVAGSAPGILDQLVANGNAGIYAVEGPNEYDASRRANWPAELRAYQTEIYNHVKASPSKFGSILVMGPSLITSPLSPQSSQQLGDISNIIDVGSHHHYVPFGSNIDSNTDEVVALMKRNNFISKPFDFTETGICTNTSLNSMCVSEKVQAKYVLRNVLDKFRANPGGKTFIYQFADADAGAQSGWGWGLLNNNAQKRPSFYALKNLITLLKDGDDSDFTPGSLTYELTSGSSLANVRQVLVQKKDGTFYLMVWQAVPSAEHRTNPTYVELNPALISATITISTAENVDVYEPTPVNSTDVSSGITPRQSFSNVTSFSVSIPDHVLVIKIGGDSEGSGNCTNIYTKDTGIPDGYGASYNFFGTDHELLLEANNCSESGITVTVGNDDTLTYAYKLGYQWSGTEWQQYDLTGTHQIEGELWYNGSADGTVSLPSQANQPKFFVAFTCQLLDNAWKCGCRDEACMTPAWQLQGAMRQE